MKLRRILIAFCVVALLIAVRFASVDARVESVKTIKIQRPLMGTIWNLEVVDHGRPEEARRAIDKAYKELERIDALMSEWKPQSPISQVNAAAGKHAVEVPEELRDLLVRAKQYGEGSGGAFDVTWHGMASIWHFDDSFTVPSRAAVEAARRNVDFRAIQIEGNDIFLPRTGMSIGLGGIAKGYAIDRASAALAQAGFKDTLVDGGGDVLASGAREDGGPWRLGIQDPRAERGTMLGLVRASKGAVVTSGDYERFRMVNGVRYHHIIDPRTGYPANRSMSVTVVAENAERAVVLCKPIFILGGEEGLAFARAQHVEALIIGADGKRWMTEGFGRVFERQ